MAASVAVFVLAGSLALVWAFERNFEHEERRAFEQLAVTNARFIERTKLPQSEQTAAQLGEIIGAKVFFWQIDKKSGTGRVIGKKGDHLPSIAFKMSFDGEVETLDHGSWMVGLPGREGSKVIFMRPAAARVHALSRSDTWLALAVFWLLALALGTWLARRVSRPLARMAEALPHIGEEHELPPLPENRHDEIGLLAQTLIRTHDSLREERERRRVAEKQALLGRMAASLAHEVRNPVAAIRLHAQLLENAAPEDAGVSRQLIESEAARIEDLVGQWLSHAKPGPPVLADVDVVACLRQAVDLMQPQAKHAAVRVFPIVSPPVIIRADRHRLQQVFTNLLRNAIQAMPAGGDVSVKVAESSDEVEVLIEDTGPGFSGSALARLGEPFYSEKEGGMGLGIAVAREICEAHGGRLLAENLPHGGARVRAVFAKHGAPPASKP